ncbi:hypothetical protein AB0C12_12745 [Actinoplanes sp. NPDC048967]|uniref:hypothetical protein n=1 Tax=Actinoplanes sp. NPDC048967 TaxID=3155269 RepID=UPI0034091D05
MAELIRRANAATLNVIDGLVLFWLLLWTAVGVWVGLSLWELAAIGDTLVQSGRTLDSAGEVLQDAGGLPLVGRWPGQLGDQVRATAAEIVGSGHDASAYGRRLAVLLAVTVGIAPVVPVLAPYLPARIARRREVAALTRLLRDPARRRMADFYLAHRAVDMVPLHRLQRVTDDPWRDLTDGLPQALADAELIRLGLRRDTVRDIRS